MPRILTDCLWDQFSRLEQDSMTITEYKYHFYMLDKHATSILDLTMREFSIMLGG